MCDSSTTPWNPADRTVSRMLGDWLLAEGFFPNDLSQTIGRGTTPLMHACRLGRGDIVEALLDAGAPLAALNADGNNALWLACYAGDTGIIERLIQHDIDIDHQNDTGASCLMYAASAGKAAVVKQLLRAGADRALRNQDDFNALELAATLECLQLLRAARSDSTTA